MTITAQDQGGLVTTAAVIGAAIILAFAVLGIRSVCQFVRAIFCQSARSTESDDAMAQSFGDIPALNAVDDEILKISQMNLRLSKEIDRLTDDRNYWKAEAKRGEDEGRAA